MKRLFVFLLSLCLVLGLLTPAANTAKATEIERYGYTQLENDVQRTAYMVLAAGVEAVKYEIPFTVYGITNENVNSVLEDIKTACAMVTRDYPEFFWFNGALSIGIMGSTVKLIPMSYSVDGVVINNQSELQPYINQLEQAVDNALSEIQSDFSDYEIAHTIHDYLVQSVEYAMEGDHQTAYGALVSGKAVCAGYAHAYQLLLNRAGISSFYITGKSYAPNGELIGHAWNLVWLDDKCYYSDVTWDDQSGDLFHEYLNLSKEQISKTHFTDDPLPPDCGHEDYTFFVKNDSEEGVCDYHGDKTPAEIADCFVLKSANGNQVSYYCTIHYHGDDFYEWFNEVRDDIIDALGLYGAISLEVIELGREHHVTLSGRGDVDIPPAEPPRTGSFEKLTKSLSLTDVIFINQRVAISGFEDINIAEKGGLLSWIGTQMSPEQAVVGAEGITNTSGLIYDEVNDRYAQQTCGIYSNSYGKTVYMRFYVEIAEGEYVYSDIYEDSVLLYCDTVLQKSTNQKQKNTCAALLYYGAAAQTYFDGMTDGLISDYIPAGYDFTYDEGLIDTLIDVPATTLIDSGKVYKFGHTLSLVEAIRINYNATTPQTANARLLLWSGC